MMNGKVTSIFGLCACAVLLFLNACGEVQQNVDWVKSKVYEVKDCTAQGSCFFQYPSVVPVSESNGNAVLRNGECEVNFGTGGPYKKDTYEVKSTINGEKIYDSWSLENTLVGYIVEFKGNDYKFWIYNEEKDVSKCVKFIDNLANSFTDKPTYFNNKYSFRIAILPDFKVEYLPNDEGMIMRRTVAGEELKKEYDAELGQWPSSAKGLPSDQPYDVEIGILVSDNPLGYQDLGAYVKSECADCTLDFWGNGVFVDEDKSEFAERVYLAMTDNGKYLYRAYLRVPRDRYKYHHTGYDQWVKTIEFF